MPFKIMHVTLFPTEIFFEARTQHLLLSFVSSPLSAISSVKQN